MPSKPEPLPAEAMRAASPESEPKVDALHAELAAPAPDKAKIDEHIAHLRGVPALAPLLESWFLHPNTQLFLTELSELGV